MFKAGGELGSLDERIERPLVVNSWTSNHRVHPEFKPNNPLKIKQISSKKGPITGGLLLLEKEGLILHDNKNSIQVLEKETLEVITEVTELKGYVTSLIFYKEERRNLKWVIACTAGYGKNMIYIWGLPDKSDDIQNLTKIGILELPDKLSDVIILEPRKEKPNFLEIISKTASSVIHICHIKIKSNKEIGKHFFYPFYFHNDNIRVMVKLFNKKLAVAFGARKNKLYVLKINYEATPSKRFKLLKVLNEDDSYHVRSIVPSKVFFNIIFTSGANQKLIIWNIFKGEKLAIFQLEETPSIFGLSLGVFEWGDKKEMLRSIEQLNCVLIHSENSSKSIVYACRIVDGKGGVSVLWEDNREILDSPKVFYNPMQIHTFSKNNKKPIKIYFSSGPFEFKETFLEEELKIFKLKLV